MTSEITPIYADAYVWVWLPEATEPVVAGLLSRQGAQLVFNYGRSYLARKDAMALYEPELPLQSGAIALVAVKKSHSSGRNWSASRHAGPRPGIHGRAPAMHLQRHRGSRIQSGMTAWTLCSFSL